MRESCGLSERTQAEPVMGGGAKRNPALEATRRQDPFSFSYGAGICVEPAGTSSDVQPRTNICLEMCPGILPRDLRGYQMRS